MSALAPIDVSRNGNCADALCDGGPFGRIEHVALVYSRRITGRDSAIGFSNGLKGLIRQRRTRTEGAGRARTKHLEKDK